MPYHTHPVMSVNIPAPWSMWVIWRWMWCAQSHPKLLTFFFRMETAVVIHLLKVKVGWCRTDEPKFISTAITGWWFGTWLLFSIIYGTISFHILGMSSSQLTIFQRGRSTTNQGKMMVVNQWLWGTCSDKAVFAYTFAYFYRVYFLWRKVSIWEW